VTRDLSLILQALVILCVSADGVWGALREQIKTLTKKQWQRKNLSDLGDEAKVEL
jgi:hypothetical protein